MQKRRLTRTVAAVATAAGLALACSGGDEPPQATAPPAGGGSTGGGDAGAVALASAGDPAKGEQIYKNVCTACHGGNPSQAGSAGPAIAGSSYELLVARVLYGEYPPGYTPKQPGGAMPKLPYLKDHIGDLAAYLAAAEEG